jgi:ubiquinone/menaquinone biosynthesis C-methylase UbiE
MDKNNNNQRHEHSGKSSAEFLISSEILKKIELKHGEVVLDLGSGAGYFSIAAATSVGIEGKVYAIDVDEKAISVLNKIIEEKNISNLEALNEDVTQNISVPKKSIDVCLMVNVLHGFVANQEVDAVIRVVHPVLKDGARLLIIDFKKSLTTPGPPQEIRLSPEDVAVLLKRHRFVSERVFDAGPYNFGQVLRKTSELT